MLSQLQDDTPSLYVSGAQLLLGLGLGATIPTMTLAVQNAVDWSDLGVASSAVTFIRSLGGAIGLAAYGPSSAAASRACRPKWRRWWRARSRSRPCPSRCTRR